jgi:hypothetical protein
MSATAQIATTPGPGGRVGHDTSTVAGLAAAVASLACDLSALYPSAEADELADMTVDLFARLDG